MDLKRILNPNLTLKQKDELGGGVALGGGSQWSLLFVLLLSVAMLYKSYFHDCLFNWTQARILKL